MKRIVVQTLLLLMCIPSFSQERISSAELDRKDSFSAKGVSFSSKKDKVAIQYILQESAYVELYVSLDGGESYYGPLIELSGTSGNVQKSTVTRFIYWNPVKEFGGIESDAVMFRVVTSPQKDREQLKREKRKVFSHENAIWVGLDFGYGRSKDKQSSDSILPIGISAGVNNIAGSRFGSFVTANLEIVRSVLSVGLGPTFRIADRWYLQGGPLLTDLTSGKPLLGGLLGTSYLLSEHFSFSVSVSAFSGAKYRWDGFEGHYDTFSQFSAQIGIAWVF